MNPNPLLELEALGQSIWIDFIRRGMISSGELQRLIEQDGVSGVTSNPSIFEKAIGESHDYDEALHALWESSCKRDAGWPAAGHGDHRAGLDLQTVQQSSQRF